MPVTEIIAIALGAGVAGLGLLLTRTPRNSDPSMAWEGRVAVGAFAMLFVGPVWLAQLVFTIVATTHSGATPWLWAWLFGSVLIAATRFGGTPP